MHLRIHKRAEAIPLHELQLQLVLSLVEVKCQILYSMYVRCSFLNLIDFKSSEMRTP